MPVYSCFAPGLAKGKHADFTARNAIASAPRFACRSGDEPNQIDYIMLGNFLWCASLASHPPLAKDDSLWDWLNRGFDLFDGIGRDSRLYPLAA